MADLFTTYRVYCFDTALRSLGVEEIAAGSDEQAIALAQAAGLGDICEIWDGKRLVAELAGERRQA